MKKILIVDDVAGWVRFHRNNINYLNIPDLIIDESFCAKQALSKIESSIDKPYDIIFTDLQMESDFLPLSAGEWLIKQIKTYDKYYKNTKIVIISASPNIEYIAKNNKVYYLSKFIARNSEPDVYRKFFN